MELAIDELKRSQKYHIRQLDENLNEIRSKEEAIEMLKKSNEKHIRIIEQIDQLIALTKKN